MAQEAPGKANRKGLTMLHVADMFRDEDAARAWVCGATLAERPALSRLRFIPRPVRHQAQDDDASVPRLPRAPHVHAAQGDGHGGV